MEHFETQEWIDFSRGLGGAEKQQEMVKHLASGCETCEATAKFWQGITQAASREAAYTPPGNVVRCAKGMGALRRLPASRPLSVVIADLITDSSRLPAAVGVRSSGAAPQLLLYKSGKVNIDLHIERVPASNHVLVVGQVLDLDQPATTAADVQVAALSDSGERHRTTTNGFGEFQLEFEPETHMYLAIKMSEEKHIWVPLHRFEAFAHNSWY